MTYEITIEKVETIKTTEQEYEKLHDDPKGAEKEYGYVTHEVEKEKRTLVFSQVTEVLNLINIIEAVNGK